MTPEQAKELNDAYAEKMRERRKQLIAAGLIRPSRGEEKRAETGN